MEHKTEKSETGMNGRSRIPNERHAFLLRISENCLTSTGCSMIISRLISYPEPNQPANESRLQSAAVFLAVAGKSNSHGISRGDIDAHQDGGFGVMRAIIL